MASKQEKSGGSTPSPHYLIGAVKPWVQAAADEIGTRFGIAEVLGVGKRDGVSDHPLGLATDFMVTGPKGTQLRDYVIANATRLGVTYVIWQQHIWSVARAAEGLRPMADRGSITANHYDHVHVSYSPSGGTGGRPTMPSIPVQNAAGQLVDRAAVAALLDPLPWFGNQLKDRVDEATAAVIKAVTGLVIAGVLVGGGVALVVGGLARAADKKPSREES